MLGVESSADTETTHTQALLPMFPLSFGQLRVLTSHHPQLTVIKQPVIRTGTHACSENDGSESAGTTHNEQHQRNVLKEEDGKAVVKNRWKTNACQALKYTNRWQCVRENISLHVCKVTREWWWWGDVSNKLLAATQAGRRGSGGSVVTEGKEKRLDCAVWSWWRILHQLYAHYC